MPLDAATARDIILPAGGWRPREYQRPLWRYLENGGTRACAIFHRRSGKDEVALHWTAIAAHMRVGNYWHMLPEANQARKAIWAAVNPHTGKRRINEAFPVELRAQTLENEMFIRFKNGSTWQVVGSDRFDSLVGSAPIGIVFSEWAISHPAALAYLSPILRENKGWSLFITTPRGRNHAFRMYEDYAETPGYFAQRLDAGQTEVFTSDELDEERRSLIAQYGEDMGNALFEQEYMVSWDAAILGSYWGAELAKAEREGRIGTVPVDPTLPVHTGWDIGRRDSTAIWFFQTDGRRLRFVDYYENHTVDAEHYAREVLSRGYLQGTAWLPHDGRVIEWTAKRTRAETLVSYGLNAQIIPDHRLMDGINSVRQVMDRCEFDAKRCAQGLAALKAYQKEWNEKMQRFSDEPLHNWASHCFTGDTKVLTRDGTRQIMDLATEGEVLTPCGWKRYKNPRVTRKDAPLVGVQFEDGTTVKCTPDHTFLTDRGWISAQHLLPGTVIQSSLTKSPNIGMAAFIGSGRNLSIIPGAAKLFTALCGRLHSARSILATTSIIGTGMLRTMPSRTWNAFQRTNISPMSGIGVMLPGRCGTQVSMPEIWQQSGTLRMRDGFGTADTQSVPRLGLSGSVLKPRARSVLSLIRRLSAKVGIHKSGVPLHARELRIAAVSALNYRADVWCLTVPEAGCFSLENGAVVHNCADAFRSAVVGWAEDALPKPRKPAPTLAVGRTNRATLNHLGGDWRQRL